MKKIIKLSIFCILTVIFCLPNVFAKSEAFYKNHAGVEMTKEEYEYLSNHFDKRRISNFNKEKFELAIKDYNNIKTLKEEVVYVKTTTITSPLKEISSFEQIITEDEYNDFQPVRLSCNYGDTCYETNAKRIYLVTDRYATNKLCMDVYLDWKTIPVTRSFDVLAARWTDSNSGLSFDEVIGYQDLGAAAATGDILYVYQAGGSEHTNIVHTSNGVGISMNVVDNLTEAPKMGMSLYYTINNATTMNFYTTYQHATSSLTLAQSKSYSFASNGLGGVLYYSNSTIRNKYDGMGGLYYGMYFAM